MSRTLPYTVAAAAELLDLSPVRVRQLIAEGVLRPVRLPGLRDNLLRPADVEHYAYERYLRHNRELRKAAEYTTLPLGRIPEPAAPRPLALEDITRLHPDGPLMHVRIFAGPDDHAVVLLGIFSALDPSPFAPATVGTTIRSLHELWPDLPLSSTALVLIHPDPHDRLTAWGLSAAWVSGSLQSSSTRAARVDEIADVDFSDLVTALGARPVLYHRSAYTPAAVERYQATSAPVPSGYDGAHLAELAGRLQAVATLEGRAADTIREHVARAALEHLDRGQPMAMERETADGVVEADWLTYPWKPQGSRLTAAPMPSLLEAWTRQHTHLSAEDPLPSDALNADREALIELAEQNDQFHADAKPAVREAAEWTLAQYHSHLLRQQRYDEVDVIYPRRRTRTYEYSLHDVAAREYLTTLVEQAPPAHITAQLEKQGPGLLDATFGIDGSGTWVTWGTDAYGTACFSALEQVAPTPLAASDHLQTGSGEVGRIPLFIIRDGRTVGLLSDPQRSPGFCFGYHGSGPSNAARAIRAAIETSGLTLAEDADDKLWRWIASKSPRPQLPISALLA